MRICIVLFTFLASFNIYSEEPVSVVTKSFSRVTDNLKNKTAEFCGKVEGQKVPKRIIVDIISDPRSKKPTPFSSISQIDGNFCILITTHMGEAIARIGNGPKTEAFID
ncbi:MAG: hypothetical protein VYD54_03305 [Bdellovibrionota bacterium]|nr:hypothetical protein [Bdellovibrionota bacterium]